MKKVFDGKLYDTETATKLCADSWEEGNFRFTSEALYRTKNGRYFLAGESGPMGRYAHTENGSTSGGRGLVPLDEGDAREWMEEHGDAVDFEEAFGDVEEA